MRKLSSLALAGLFGVGVLSAACGRNDSSRADSALANDLSLAAQARGYQPLDSLSPAERAAAGAALAGGAAAAAPVRSSPTRARTTSGTRPRTTTSSGGTVTQRAPEQREVVVKHTKRDAAIGAAAGAIIGAATSKDKVKGGVIGAAVGGILGGVIGNNVDKTKKKVP